MRTIFTVKSTEDQKSKYKPGSGYYLRQTLKGGKHLEVKYSEVKHSEVKH